MKIYLLQSSTAFCHNFKHEISHKISLKCQRPARRQGDKEDTINETMFETHRSASEVHSESPYLKQALCVCV
jgi:hypothetical protein